MVLTDLKFRFAPSSQFLSFSVLRPGGHMSAMLLLLGFKNLDISFWFINSILKKVFSKAKQKLQYLLRENLYLDQLFLGFHAENVLERHFAVWKRLEAN